MEHRKNGRKKVISACNMEEDIAKKLPARLPRNRLLDSLPYYLKDPANYEKIRKAIFEAGASTCDHAEVIEWAGCMKCQRKQWDRKETMARLGFQNGQQYLMWARTHERIRSLQRDRLEKYNT